MVTVTALAFVLCGLALGLLLEPKRALQVAGLLLLIAGLVVVLGTR